MRHGKQTQRVNGAEITLWWMFGNGTLRINTQIKEAGDALEELRRVARGTVSDGGTRCERLEREVPRQEARDLGER